MLCLQKRFITLAVVTNPTVTEFRKSSPRDVYETILSSSGSLHDRQVRTIQLQTEFINAVSWRKVQSKKGEALVMSTLHANLLETVLQQDQGRFGERRKMLILGFSACVHQKEYLEF